MSRERELLKRVIKVFDSVYSADLIDEIQELLAQPEQRLTPLTSKLISLGNNCHESFIKGVRFAEKMHGITGGGGMSKEREMMVKAWKLLIYSMGGKIGEGVSSIKLKFLYELTEYISQPEQPEQDNLTPRQGFEGYTKGYMMGYNVAVRDLKTKIDSVFNLIMEDEDE